MNERIKELAEKAGFGMWADEDWNPGDAIDWSARYDEELQNFYKLVIQECTVFLKDTMDDHFAAEQLEEQFGVEE